MQEDQGVKDKVEGKMGEQATSLNAYAARHPRRMWTSAFLIGMGTGMLAIKSRREKSGLQKFLDRISD